MNLVEEYPVLQGHRISWDTYAAISTHCWRTNLVAASDSSAKASPVKPRARLAKGSGRQICGEAWYSEIDPQRTIMAASWRHFFEALDEKSLMIRSAVSWSARIRSAARAYPIDRAASEAPAAKYRASVSVETRRVGGAAVNIKHSLSEKREIDSSDKREALQ